MTTYHLLDAIGMIDDEDILDAKKNTYPHRNRTVERQPFITGKNIKRIAVCFAAVIAIMLSSFATAMAVNENFRAAVFSFFHISTPDISLPIKDEPQQADTVEKIYETSIENTVSIDYIRTSENFNYGRGLIYLYGEADREDAFYTVQDGQLKKLQTNETNITYVWENTKYNISFDWCIENGEIYVNSIGKVSANDASWYISPIPGSTNTVVLTLSYGRQDDYTEFPLLLNLKTNEVTNPLADSGLDYFAGIISTEFSPDISMVLITCDNDDAVYCCDLLTKKSYMLSDFTGSPVEAAWFLNDGTICCIAENGTEHYDCFNISSCSNVCTAVFEDLAKYSSSSEVGVIFTGTRYGLYIESDKTTYILDLKTGQQLPVEGLLYSGDSMTISANAAGTKILFAMFDRKADGLGITQLGIIDTERNTFTLLDCEGYDIREETAVGWFDDERISIQAENDSGEKYLYLYSFVNCGSK